MALSILAAFAFNAFGWPTTPLIGFALSCATGLLLIYATLASRIPATRKACDILLLRGFGHERQAQLNERLFPVIGCYGRVIALRDPMHRDNEQWLGPVRASLLANIRSHVVSTDVEWRAEVLTLLARATIVVIDVSEITANVLREVDMTLTRTPVSRVIIVGELSPTIHENFRTVASRYLAHDLLIASMNLAMYPSRRYLLGRFWMLWPFKLERLINMYMRRIRQELLVAQSVQTSDG